MIPDYFDVFARRAIYPNDLVQNDDPSVVQQREQAENLIDFVECLPIEVPEFDGDIIEEAESIRVWMRSSEEIRTCESLQLDNLELANLPPEIGLFLNLKQLDLSNNQLVALPPEIGNCTALNRLVLRSNRLEVLPPEIGKLLALADLNLTDNQIVALPPEIRTLSALTRLTLTDNPLEALPPEIGNLLALTELYASNTGLVDLPAEIVHLVALTKLNLSKNAFAAVPAEIWHLRSLIALNLSGNELVALPAEIKHLVALEHLDLSSNQLAAVPVEIGHLRSLRSLDLSKNRLVALPVEMGNLAALRGISLQGNRLVVSPPEIEHLWALHSDIVPPISRRQLRGWSSEFESAFPQDELANAEHWESRTIDFTPLTTLPDEEQQSFTTYLSKIRETQDYESGGPAQRNVILRVERMVQLACKNPEFKNAMLALIAEGLESCGDRVLMTFNEIEIQWQFDHKELSDEEFKALAIRASRYYSLKRYAKKIAEEKGFRDEIETTLFYHIELRRPLNLPITTEGMLYPDASGVDPEMLNQALVYMRGYSDEDLLAQSDHWKALMAIRHPLLVAEIELRYADLHETVGEYYRCDEENRAVWLEAHPDPELHEILRESEREGDNYDIAGKIVMRKRAFALSQPENAAAAQP